jgi:hypothetical protein
MGHNTGWVHSLAIYQLHPLLLPATHQPPLHRTADPHTPNMHPPAPGTILHTLATCPNTLISAPMPHRYWNKALSLKTNWVMWLWCNMLIFVQQHMPHLWDYLNTFPLHSEMISGHLKDLNHPVPATPEVRETCHHKWLI